MSFSSPAGSQLTKTKRHRSTSAPSAKPEVRQEVVEGLLGIGVVRNRIPRRPLGQKGVLKRGTNLEQRIESRALQRVTERYIQAGKRETHLPFVRFAHPCQ